MKILVTGGSGYLGTHVRRFFQADDFSRRSFRDVLNPYDAETVADYDVVIHLAAHMDKSREAAETCFVTHYVESVKRGWPIRLPLEGKPVRDILHEDGFARACRAFIDSSRAS